MKTSKNKYDITGMTCSACSARVEKSVRALPGVSEVNVNLLTNNMTVEYEPEQIASKDIINAVEKSGYGAMESRSNRAGSQTVQQSNKEEYLDQNLKSASEMKRRVWLSVAFLLPLMYLAMHHMLKEWFGIPVPEWIKTYFHGNENAIAFSFTQLLLLVPILIFNRKYFLVGFKTLLHRSPNMDSLIAIGSGAAVLYGIFSIYRIGYGLGYSDLDLVGNYVENLYFESAGTILTLVTVGKYLETRSKGKTSLAITKLMDMAPKTAWREEQGKVVEIPVEELQKDDIFQIKPGSSFPVDGVIIEGRTLVDESAITGESIPVEKTVGDKVVSGTVNQTGFIRCRAEKVGEDTTLAKIIALVEEASSSKAPIAKMADRISGVFVPIVIAIALATFLIWILAGMGFEFALTSAIAVLVISCPCALGLATPVAIMVGTGKGAGLGILIKSGEALEHVSQIDTAVFDKTGTLTQGKPEVTDHYLAEGVIKEEFFALAAGMESSSEHPLAEAVVREAERLKITPVNVSEFTAIPGRGIVAFYQGRQILAGNQSMMSEHHVAISDLERDQIIHFAEDGKTPLLFAVKENDADQGRLSGILAVADTVKMNSAAAIRAFSKMGIRTIMLTGDHEITAKAIQKKLQLDEVIAQVLPDQKEEKIRALQESGKKVLMIGDGINDAPALMRADVGAAIGAGSDIAIESADMILMHDDIMDAVSAVRLGKAVIRNIKQNLFWAFIYNVIGIPIAAGVFYHTFGWQLSPMFGAAAMSFSSIFVVSNALRLRWFKESVAEKRIKKNMPERNFEQKPEFKPEHKSEQKPEQKLKNKEELKMEQKRETILSIEGMMCEHCKKSVTKALSEIEGVEEVIVDLEAKNATVIAATELDHNLLKSAVEEAGYTVVG